MKMPVLSILTIALLVACAPPSAVRVTKPAEVAADASKSASSATALPIADLAIETPGIYAADLLPASMLAGPQFEVGANLAWKGHMAAFSVKSDYGRIDADSAQMLQERINEIAALAELERMSELKVAGKAAATSIKNTGKALYNVFRNPEATARAIPDALKTKVANTWDAIKLKSKELSDDARSRIRDESAPPEFNAFLADPPSSPEKTWQQRANTQGRKFGLDYIGYNQARRELTRELNIDPYTSNPQIEDRLDAFAWSYLAGSKGAGFTVGALTGGAGVVLSKAYQINKLVYDLAPEDVRKYNRSQLKSIGIDGDVARFFLRNSNFTPTMQTAVTDRIVANWEAAGWKDLLGYLRYVDSEVEARFIVNALAMLEQQKIAGRMLKQVSMIGVNPVFSFDDATLFVPAPVDYVHHNAKLKAFLGEPALRNREVAIAVSGKVSELAKQAIAQRGFALIEGQHFDGAPAYAQDEQAP